jgi:hypothetical protein
MDYSGRPIGPLRLARAMNINIVAGSCIMAALAVLWQVAAIDGVVEVLPGGIALAFQVLCGIDSALGTDRMGAFDRDR